MKIEKIFISTAHNFQGYHGRDPGVEPTQDVHEVECVKGAGLKGDRFFNHKPDFKGQITFFSREVYETLCNEFAVLDKGLDVFRRNIIVSGIDLNTLIDQEFEVQGIRFFGTEEAAPCYWMDQAFCVGAHEALKGYGGLRARILSSGTLKVDS